MKHQSPVHFQGNGHVVFILILVLLSFNAEAKDSYQPGDTLYIWCKRGFKLRKTPEADAKVIGVLNHGSEVVVVEKTGLPMHIHPFRNFPGDSEPLPKKQRILYGSWVRVSSHLGTGYVLDQYLLACAPFQQRPGSIYGIPLQICKSDTTGSVDDPVTNYLMHIRTEFHHGVIMEEIVNEKGSDATYMFPHMTIEEVLILFMNSNHELQYGNLVRNREDAISIEWSICLYEMTQTPEGVRVSATCSC